MNLISEEVLDRLYEAAFAELAVIKDGKVVGTRTIPLAPGKRTSLSEKFDEIFGDNPKLSDNIELVKGLFRYLKTPTATRKYGMTSVQGVKGGLYLIGLPTISSNSEAVDEQVINNAKTIMTKLFETTPTINYQVLNHKLGISLDDKGILSAIKNNQVSGFKVTGDNISVNS